MKPTIIKGILIGSLVFLLSACGGGGGGTPTGVSVGGGGSNTSSLANNIIAQVGTVDDSLSVLQSNSISALTVNGNQFQTAIDGFEAIATLKTTVDGLSDADWLSLRSMYVTITYEDGTTDVRTLTDAIDIAYGMYTRYYEPYKSFWQGGADNGSVDETSDDFTSLAAKVNADKDKDKNYYYDTYTAGTLVSEEFVTVYYTGISTIDIVEQGTRTKSTYTEYVTDDSSTTTDDWPAGSDGTTADGCNCVRTYTVTYTITEVYDSWREDTISYKRTDTINTWSNNTTTTTYGQPEVTNTVTGATQEQVTAVNDAVATSWNEYTESAITDDGSDDSTDDDTDDSTDDSDDSTDDSDDSTDDTVYHESDLGTKTTGLPTDPDAFLTGEVRGYCSNWQGCSLDNLTVWTENDIANGTGTSYQHIEAAGINDAWSKGWTGDGVNVGIIDTGVNIEHDELDGQIGGVYNNDSTDWNGHGSHVAGTIVAKRDGQGTVGVAFDSKLYVVRSANLSYNDSEYWDFFNDNNVDVVNLSINGRWDSNISFDDTYVVGSDPNNQLDTYKSLSLIDADKNLYKWNKTVWYGGSYVNLNQVIAQDDDGNFVYGGMGSIETLASNMANSEIILVNSAGNSQRIAMAPGWYATATNDDGSLMLDGRLIIVGSYDPASSTNNGYSANAGSICWTVVNDVCQDEYHVSDFFIRAPEAMTSLDNVGDNYEDMSGTSMAAPVVTGSIALLRQMWPHMTGSNTVQLILVTADSSYSGYNVGIDGHGRLDMDAATQPIGATGIPTDGRTDGNTTSSNGYVAGNNELPSSLSSLIVEVDDFAFNRDWLIPLADAHVPVDTAFHSFTNYAGLTTVGNNDFAVHLRENNSTDSLAVTVNGTTFGYMKEDGQYLGRYFNGMFDIGETQTAFLQTGETWNLGSNSTLSANVNLGYTKVDTISNSLINSSDDLMSYGWRIQNDTALNSNWSLTGFISQPVSVFSGNMNIHAPTSRGNNTSGNTTSSNESSANEVHYTDTEWSQSAKVETDLGVGINYNKNDFSWSLEGISRYDTAVGNDYTVTTSFKWHF